MNFLITGGLGHIGSYLIRFLPRDDSITIVDNMLTQRYCSLFNINRKIKFIEKSFAEISDVDLETIDVVIHLAAITNAEKSFNNNEIEEINKNLTKKFLDKCKNKLVVFPSSTSVYGVSADVVFEDDEKYVNPQSPYAESKIYIEKAIQQYCDKWVILRLGTIFGISPGMRFHTAVNKFCYQAAIGEQLTIWKENFHQVRPYLGINDACRAIHHVICQQCYNQKFNVVTKNIKLSDIVAIIQKIKPSVKLKFVDTPLINQYSYNVSNQKIANTGFAPNDDIAQVIEHTIQMLNIQ
jgi:UDP-glucose 4-epimerase